MTSRLLLLILSVWILPLSLRAEPKPRVSSRSAVISQVELALSADEAPFILGSVESLSGIVNRRSPVLNTSLLQQLFQVERNDITAVIERLTPSEGLVATQLGEEWVWIQTRGVKEQTHRFFFPRMILGDHWNVVCLWNQQGVALHTSEVDCPDPKPEAADLRWWDGRKESVGILVYDPRTGGQLGHAKLGLRLSWTWVWVALWFGVMLGALSLLFFRETKKMNEDPLIAKPKESPAPVTLRAVEKTPVREPVMQVAEQPVVQPAVQKTAAEKSPTEKTIIDVIVLHPEWRVHRSKPNAAHWAHVSFQSEVLVFVFPYAQASSEELTLFQRRSEGAAALLERMFSSNPQKTVSANGLSHLFGFRQIGFLAMLRLKPLGQVEYIGRPEGLPRKSFSPTWEPPTSTSGGSAPVAAEWSGQVSVGEVVHFPGFHLELRRTEAQVETALSR